jgi:hypothetical protein
MNPPESFNKNVDWMGPKQRKILAVGSAIFLITVLFPPWVFTFDANGNSGGHSRKPAGYSSVFSPPEPKTQGSWVDTRSGVELDGKKLCLEWLGLAGALGLALLIAPRQGEPKPQHRLANLTKDELAALRGIPHWTLGRVVIAMTAVALLALGILAMLGYYHE